MSTNNDIIAALLTALRKIGEQDQALPATSSIDWRRRAQIIARLAVEEAEKGLRNRAEQVIKEAV